MRTQATQEAWLFLNHLLSMMGMDRITDVSAMNEDKNISLENQKKLWERSWQPGCRESGWSLR